MKKVLIERPNIKPYRTPFGFYIYDVYSNEIVKVSKQLYDFIQGINDEIDDDGFSDYKILYDSGYFHAVDITDLEHPETKNLAAYLDRKVEGIVLQLTQNCNLRCQYCIYSEDNFAYQRKHANRQMTVETMKNALDFLHQHSIDSTKVSIGFYGGEPLLEFELIKQAVAYANEIFKGKHIIYIITTNGTILPDAVIDFLAGNGFRMTLSLDGPEQIHDSNRVFASSKKGSFKTIRNNLKRIYERQPNFMKNITANMVVTLEHSLDEIKGLFQDPYFKMIRAQTSNVERDSGHTEFSPAYTTSAGYYNFLTYLAMADSGFYNAVEHEKLIVKDVKLIRENFSKMHPTKLGGVCCPSGPCVPGKRKLFCTVDGKLLPCERISETAACMQIGDIYTGFNLKNADSILNICKLSKEECKNCWAITFCKACVKATEDKNEISAQKKLQSCERFQAEANVMIKTRILLSELKTHWSEGKL